MPVQAVQRLGGGRGREKGRREEKEKETRGQIVVKLMTHTGIQSVQWSWSNPDSDLAKHLC